MKACMLVLPLLLPAFGAITSHAETVPDDGDRWSEYDNWVEALEDGWSTECGLTLQLITPHTGGDHMVGEGSVGFELLQGVWNKKFYYEGPTWSENGQSMEGFEELRFWYRTTWVTDNPVFHVRAYIEPTAEETASGVLDKRLEWTLPTAVAWTEFSGRLDGADWQCYVGPIWQSCEDTHSLTFLRKLEWDYFELFGPGLGEQTLIDGLHFRGTIASIQDGAGGTAASTLSCHPNPFRRSTVIRVLTEGPRPVELGILDTAGRRVRTLRGSSGSAVEGIAWDGRDDRGERLPAGIYFARTEPSEGSRAHKIILVD